MAADCILITRGSTPACPEGLPAGGTRARLVLINKDDLDDDAPFTINSDGIVTAINLKPGKSAYAFYGFRNDIGKTDEIVHSGVGPNQFKHGTKFICYERTQVQKNNLEKVARGRFVAVAENKGQDADAMEVLGIKVGLEAVAGPIRDAHANGGFFVITLSTLDGEHEPKLPQTLGTSYSNAVTIMDAIIAANS